VTVSNHRAVTSKHPELGCRKLWNWY